eukprot:2335072-Pleurochrysis_carterae.AAC.1
MKTEEELLKFRPGDKLREITEMMKTQGISLMTLTDTHLGREGMEEVGKFLQQEGLEGGGIAASRELTEGGEYSARRKAGIYFIWDPTKLSVDGMKEVYASRVASVNIYALDSGNSLGVYGVYMPVRNNKTEKTEGIWEALTQDITDKGNRNFVINGDFNAETEAWIHKPGRAQKEEDVIYQGIIEDLNLVPSVTEEYTFERARTQIDNVLIPIELVHNLKAAYTSPGVREKDHKMVMVVFAWGMKGDKGESRPTKRHTDKFQEKHWLQYEQILQERTKETREKMGNKGPGDRLRIIQNELMRAAAEVAGENTKGPKGTDRDEEDKYNYGEERALNKEEGFRERKRHQTFMWGRYLHHARRYTGGDGKIGGFWRRKEIGNDYILSRIARANRKARRARVIEICEEQKGKAEEQLKEIRREMRKTANTDTLIKSLMNLGKGAGNVVIRVFDIIKKAGGNGERAQRGIAGVYQDDDNGKTIIRGPEIKEEVHKIATHINAAGTIDVKAVKDVLRWLGIKRVEAREKDRKEEINRICTTQKGKLALSRFQQNKGLGTDGFDGFLIRNAPLEWQDIYHETITDILVQEDYPAEWNEWLAVLMMKPGEDPFELGRRRDIWLQCHSMKYACRLLEAEYKE